MYLNHKFGWLEGQDVTQLPEYQALPENKQKQIQEVYHTAYQKSLHLGINMARGKAHEDAKLALIDALQPVPVKEQEIPLSIFSGLSNCE